MAYNIIAPFDVEENYIYGNSQIQLINGNCKLLAQVVGAEALCYLKLDENKGLVASDSSGNNNHGSFQGGLSETNWTTGKINYGIQGVSLTNGFINLDQLIEFERTDEFSLECWFKTTSSSTMSLISKQMDSGNFEGFAINYLAGKCRLVVRDASGNIISKENGTIINDGAWHHIVFTYDGSSSISGCCIYVDNVENDIIVSSDTLIDTITNTADFQISGRDGNNICLDANSYIDEVLIYERALTPAEISFRWNNGDGTQQIPGASTAFPTDNPTITSSLFVRVTEFASLSGTVTETGNDKIKAVVVVNGIDYYWDGSSWEISLGYSQSNTIAEINTNANTLLSEKSNIKMKWYLHSDDGATTPIISDYTMFVNDEADAINAVETNVEGYLWELDGSASIDTEFKVRSVRIIGTNVVTVTDFINVTIAVDGSWEISIIVEDVAPSYLEWRIGEKIYKTNYLAGSIKFSDLTILWENTIEVDTIGT